MSSFDTTPTPCRRFVTGICRSCRNSDGCASKLWCDVGLLFFYASELLLPFFCRMNCPKHFTFRYTLEQPRESGGEFEQSGYCRVAGGPGNNYSPQAPISPPCKCSSIYVTLLSCLMPRPSLPPSSMYVQCNHLLYLLHVRNFNVFVGINTIGHILKRGAHTAALFFNKFIVFSSRFPLHHPIIRTFHTSLPRAGQVNLDPECANI